MRCRTRRVSCAAELTATGGCRAIRTDRIFSDMRESGGRRGWPWSSGACLGMAHQAPLQKKRSGGDGRARELDGLALSPPLPRADHVSGPICVLYRNHLATSALHPSAFLASNQNTSEHSSGPRSPQTPSPSPPKASAEAPTASASRCGECPLCLITTSSCLGARSPQVERHEDANHHRHRNLRPHRHHRRPHRQGVSCATVRLHAGVDGRG